MYIYANLNSSDRAVRHASLHSDSYVLVGETCEDRDEEEEEEDDEEEDEDEEEEDEEDDQEMMPIMEKRATMFARWPDETPAKWEIVGLGNLAIHYDSDIYAERIVLKLDDSEEYASNTIISMESVMQVIIYLFIKYREHSSRRDILVSYELMLY